MSVLGELLGTLDSMSMLQLLLAFLACTGYALAQGGLTGPRGRNAASALAVIGAAGFTIESSEWAHAAVLLAAAVAGLGLFVATAWATSSLLGLAGSAMQLSRDRATPDPVSEPGAGQPQPARGNGPAPAT